MQVARTVRPKDIRRGPFTAYVCPSQVLSSILELVPYLCVCLVSTAPMYTYARSYKLSRSFDLIEIFVGIILPVFV